MKTLMQVHGESSHVLLADTFPELEYLAVHCGCRSLADFIYANRLADRPVQEIQRVLEAAYGKLGAHQI